MGSKKVYLVQISFSRGVGEIPNFAENDIAEFGFLEKPGRVQRLDESGPVGVDLSDKGIRTVTKIRNERGHGRDTYLIVVRFVYCTVHAGHLQRVEGLITHVVTDRVLTIGETRDKSR